nr:MAG TPA: hypothetical protein [Caudoviricetes sp.]
MFGTQYNSLPHKDYCITKIRHRIGVIFVPIFTYT